MVSTSGVFVCELCPWADKFYLRMLIISYCASPARIGKPTVRMIRPPWTPGVQDKCELRHLGSHLSYPSLFHPVILLKYSSLALSLCISLFSLIWSWLAKNKFIHRKKSRRSKWGSDQQLYTYLCKAQLLERGSYKSLVHNSFPSYCFLPVKIKSHSKRYGILSKSSE